VRLARSCGLVACLVAMGVTGCSGAKPLNTGELAGWVQRPGVPMCGPNCPANPTAPATTLTAPAVDAAAVTVARLDGMTVATTRSDHHGAFSLRLPAGTYRVQAVCAQVGESSGPTRPWPISVVVGATTRIALDCPWNGPTPG
jgi:Carboxypeptidase regulatory-like domain